MVLFHERSVSYVSGSLPVVKDRVNKDVEVTFHC